MIVSNIYHFTFVTSIETNKEHVGLSFIYFNLLEMLAKIIIGKTKSIRKYFKVQGHTFWK